MSTPPNRLATLAAAVAIVLGAGGCGGDSTSHTTSSVSASARAGFLKRANEICAQGARKIKLANQRAFGTHQGSPTEITAFVSRTLLPDVQAQVDHIRALPKPSGDSATVKKILDTAQKDIDTGRRDPALFLHNAPVFQDAIQLASDYGLTACGADHFF